MYSIKGELETEYTINKSRFITSIYKVASIDDVKHYLDITKKKYYDANHHTYAYVIGVKNQISKCSDDGEPSRTAGMPILEVIKKEDMTNILVIVTRYFGGIKLGAGGLTRAYAKAATNGINESIKTTLKEICYYEIKIPYNYSKGIELYLKKNTNIVKVDYQVLISYEFYIQKSLMSDLESDLFKLTEYQIKPSLVKEEIIFV